MIALNLNIRDEVYDKVMYLLQSLPKKDVQIVKRAVIDEIDPTVLPKDDFDYINKDELENMTKLVEGAIADGFKNLKSFDEL